MPFLEAVVAQVTYGLSDSLHAMSPQLEREVAESVLSLWRLVHAGPAAAEPGALDVVEQLAADAAMLAAFFQHVDLLYVEHFDGADAVSAVVIRAMELLRQTG